MNAILRFTFLFVSFLALSVSMAQTSSSPVVIELFTSESCSSCPSAEKLMNELIEKGGPDSIPILPLEYHVNYWNRLGWKDLYSLPLFTLLQRNYAQSLQLNHIFTPQLIVDGTTSLVGSDPKQLFEALRKASTNPKFGFQVSPGDSSGQIRVTLVPPTTYRWEHPLDLIAVLTTGPHESQVTSGENQGHTLTHSRVARDYLVAHTFTYVQGKESQWDVELHLPMAELLNAPHPEYSLLLQDHTTRRILGAWKRP